jgi:hypothetical protein
MQRLNKSIEKNVVLWRIITKFGAEMVLDCSLN